MLISTRCSPSRSEAVVGRQRDRRRHDRRARRPRGRPSSRRAPARSEPQVMPPTVSWPTSVPRVRHDERQQLARRGPRAVRWRTIAPKDGSGVARPSGRRRLPRPQPRRRCAPRTSRPGRRGRAAGSGAGRPVPRSAGTGQPGHAAPGPGLSGRPRAIWSTACAEQRAQHGEPVAHAAGRAGQVDDQGPPGQRRRGRGTAPRSGRRARRRTRGSPRRCPGTSRSSTRRVISGVRSVGRQPGAAGGHDDVVRRRRPRRAAPPRPARRPARRRGPSTSKPERAPGPSTSTGPVRSA